MYDSGYLRYLQFDIDAEFDHAELISLIDTVNFVYFPIIITLTESRIKHLHSSLKP